MDGLPIGPGRFSHRQPPENLGDDGLPGKGGEGEEVDRRIDAMSWLARSFASTLMADRDDGETDLTQRAESASSPRPRDGEDGDPSRGVKEDLSEITEALSRRFRGVASFLAPSPSSAASGSDADPAEASDALAFAGFRSDLAEIGGRFRSGISRLSSSKAVSEFSKIASTFLPLGPGEGEDWNAEDEEGSESKYRIDAIGVTEEVMAFVRNISMHPETWLDFPLLPDDEESDGLSPFLVTSLT
ncbi:hypothetical protein BHM03_00045117 [Ensete ventricosum]|nr:hypothetical protein BHM03_00045117 [Ensete ventricosum]